MKSPVKKRKCPTDASERRHYRVLTYEPACGKLMEQYQVHYTIPGEGYAGLVWNATNSETEEWT